MIADLDQVELWDRALDGEALWDEVFDGPRGDGRLARRLLLPRADGRLPGREGAAQRARPREVGAELPRNDLEDELRRLADAAAGARARRGRPALEALPGARRSHVLGAAGHVRRRTRDAAAADRADARATTSRSRRTSRPSGCSCGRSAKAGSRCASSSTCPSRTSRCRTPTTAATSSTRDRRRARHADAWREQRAPARAERPPGRGERRAAKLERLLAATRARARPASAIRVSVRSARHARAGVLVGDDPVEQLAVEVGARRRRCTRAPANAMNAAVGPFSTSPPTIGLTATTGRARPRAAPRACPARRGSGAIEASGFDGPITIARAPAIAVEHLRRSARACSAPRNSTPSTGPCGAVADHELLERAPAAPARAHPRAHRVVAHRQHAARARRSRAFSSRERGRRRAALRRACRARSHAPGEVAVAEVEPDVRRRARAARP